MKRILYLSILLFCVAAMACNRYERAPKSQPAVSEAQIHAKLEELEARVVRLQIKMALTNQLASPLSRETIGMPLVFKHNIL